MRLISARGAAQHDDLEAVVGVEVHVQRRDDLLVVGVLVLGELVGEVAGVVVVDQRDGADDLAVAGVPLLLDERRPDQVAERLRAVDVALLGDERVEALEQALLDRDTEPDDSSWRPLRRPLARRGTCASMPRCDADRCRGSSTVGRHGSTTLAS